MKRQQNLKIKGIERQSRNYKWCKMVFVTFSILIASVACHNKSADIDSPDEDAYQEGVEAEVTSDMMTAKEPEYNTGYWTMEHYINEYGERTDEMQFRLQLYTVNSKGYEANLFIIYKPNEYFELNGLEDYWGYHKMKVRDDNSGSEVDIYYDSKKRDYTQSYIRIESKSSVSRFFDLIEDGNFTLLMNEGNVCHVKGRSRGLTEILLKNGIYEPHIPVTSWGSQYTTYLNQYATAWRQSVEEGYFEFNTLSEADSRIGVYGLLDFNNDDIPELYVAHWLTGIKIFYMDNGVVKQYEIGTCNMSDVEYIPKKSLMLIRDYDCGDEDRITICQAEHGKMNEVVSFTLNLMDGNYYDSAGTVISEEKINSELKRLFYTKGEAWHFVGRPIGVLADYARNM